MIAVFASLITAGGILLANLILNRHNRQLKLIEIRQQAAHTIRQEKREVYLDLLRTNRRTVQHAVQLGYMELDQQLQVDTGGLFRASEKFGQLIPELELVASPVIYNLSQELYRAVGRCNDTMFWESEKRFAEFDRTGTEATLEQREAIWEEVRGEVQKTYEKSNMEQLYGQLRNQIREELGFLSLSPDLVPAAKEIEELHRELSALDQVKYESDSA